MITVLFFARLRDELGMARLEIAADEALTFSAFMSKLADQLDAESMLALQAENVRVAINQTLAAEPGPLSPGDEIAFMPPVTGG